MDIVWTIINTSVSVLSVVIFGMLVLYSILGFQKHQEEFRPFIKEIFQKYYTKKQIVFGITFLAFFFVLFIQEIRVIYLLYLLFIMYWILQQNKEWNPIKVSTWTIFFVQILWSALLYTFFTLVIPFNNIYQILILYILAAPLWTIVGIYTVKFPKMAMKKITKK